MWNIIEVCKKALKKRSAQSFIQHKIDYLGDSTGYARGSFDIQLIVVFDAMIELEELLSVDWLISQEDVLIRTLKDNVFDGHEALKNFVLDKFQSEKNYDGYNWLCAVFPHLFHTLYEENPIMGPFFFEFLPRKQQEEWIHRIQHDTLTNAEITVLHILKDSELPYEGLHPDIMLLMASAAKRLDIHMRDINEFMQVAESHWGTSVHIVPLDLWFEHYALGQTNTVDLQEEHIFV